jgi:host factor-I protein
VPEVERLGLRLLETARPIGDYVEGKLPQATRLVEVERFPSMKVPQDRMWAVPQDSLPRWTLCCSQALQRSAHEDAREEFNVTVPRTPPIQDAFLNHLRDNKFDVTMFLVNGIRLQGQIKKFDNFTVMLVRGNGTQVVFKHAISAIYPAEPIQQLDPDAAS